MADNLRKDLSDKVGETATPDSQKSTLDQVKESATGTADKVAAEVQPEGDKSISQQASDTLSGGPGEKGLVEQVQEGAEAAYNYAKETATGAYNKVNEAINSEK